MRSAAIPFLLAVSLSGPAAAGPLEDGVAAYEHRDYAAAVALWQPLADQGLAGAQFWIGELYRMGWGVPPDSAEAARWLRLAAEQGNADAQHRLGSMYYSGIGVPKDQAESAMWYERAAEQGRSDDLIVLAYLYSNGFGVEQNVVAAYKWASLAATFHPDDARRTEISERRDMFATFMSAEEIAEAERLIAAWQPK